MERSSATRTLLASDLDGTLIPPTHAPEPLRALRRFNEKIRAGGLCLAYITGRHLELALQGIDAFGLAMPDALACDVGTSIYWRRGDGFEFDRAYQERIAAAGVPDAGEIAGCLAGIPGLNPQEEEKQARFKASFYLDGAFSTGLLAEIQRKLPGGGEAVRLVDSYDPSTGRGLLDVLPKSLGKHSAVEHVAAGLGIDHERVVFAGDSGNDRDAVLSGCRAIVVGNARPELKSQLADEAARMNITERIYFATSSFAAGVLEGLGHFGELDSPA